MKKAIKPYDKDYHNYMFSRDRKWENLTFWRANSIAIFSNDFVTIFPFTF